MTPRLTLYELTHLVNQTISSALPDSYWVEAELMEIRESRGHCYMEMVQKDISSSSLVARASAKCWQSRWKLVSKKFTQATGTLPQVGMKLLILATAEFHETYGFSLIVTDIDPTYTLGEMALRREETIARLKEEGIYDLQRTLTLPLFTQHIAVISSATAAGYGDFSHQLISNEYHFHFSTTLFPAVMQGDKVGESIIAYLDQIHAQEDQFDCVVIIRGGGATSDMSAFDSLPLAENVANFPLPIITGIGHERDECALDLIAYHRAKTPTAVATFLIEHLLTVAVRIEQAQKTIHTSALLFSTRGENVLERIRMRIGSATQALFQQETHRLSLLAQRIQALNPATILSRGYTLTLHDRHVVRHSSSLHSGQELQTIFADGQVTSVVK